MPENLGLVKFRVCKIVQSQINHQFHVFGDFENLGFVKFEINSNLREVELT